MHCLAFSPSPTPRRIAAFLPFLLPQGAKKATLRKASDVPHNLTFENGKGRDDGDLTEDGEGSLRGDAALKGMIFAGFLLMDEVAQAVAKVKKEWDQSVVQIQDRIRLIESCGTSGKGTEEANSLPRLNGAAQDGLAVLRSLQFKLDFFAQQLSTEEEIQSAQLTLEFWKEQYQSLHKSLRDANLQAKNNIRKAAQQERELLLGGGEESTIRRRNLQYVIYLVTLITSKNKGWNDISCRKHYREPPPYAPNYGSGSRKKCKYFGNICCCVFRKIIFDCCECGPNSPTSGMYHAEESTGVLRRAESEYKGHRPLLMRTRNLLSTMRRQDVLDRVILVVGFLIFTSAVLYVVWKRIGLLALQRKIMAVVKAGSRGQDVVQELEIV
ncbi:hypothetical protein ZIOFF_045214 [Zingiber officinale]|uniref:Sec20 C-terminal domain-containing protein n=1 Tax=Zingiber officinale TaxID=94328 RepID=A0A8J5FWT0_ZINOF|nr:hypothetical protein ZIOFF_045214 [Zingiber officinale]